MTKDKCQKLYNKIADAFHKQSGGFFNDTLYYQWLGAKDEMNEAEWEGDWEYAHQNLSECLEYSKECLSRDRRNKKFESSFLCQFQMILPDNKTFTQNLY